MDTELSPLLPAFQLLWKAAKKESTKYNINDCVNANYGSSKQNKITNGIDDKSSKISDERFCCNGTIHEANSDCNQEDSYSNRSVTDCEDHSVVVCTLECDHGDKFVRQIIHDGTTKSVWSRAEDLFVDWLNSDLTSQHAQRIDVTVYFCRIPDSTSSDGIRLWMKNLRDEGKIVNLKIKVASLGLVVSKALSNVSNKIPQRKGRIHGMHELNEAEDTLGAIRRLVKLGAEIEMVSGGDWMQLISLLTDRASLQALDLRQCPSAEMLSTMLQSTL